MSSSDAEQIEAFINDARKHVCDALATHSRDPSTDGMTSKERLSCVRDRLIEALDMLGLASFHVDEIRCELLKQERDAVAPEAKH
jgi:hypothetical protein